MSESDVAILMSIVWLVVTIIACKLFGSLAEKIHEGAYWYGFWLWPLGVLYAIGWCCSDCMKHLHYMKNCLDRSMPAIAKDMAAVKEAVSKQGGDASKELQQLHEDLAVQDRHMCSAFNWLSELVSSREDIDRG